MKSDRCGGVVASFYHISSVSTALSYSVEDEPTKDREHSDK